METLVYVANVLYLVSYFMNDMLRLSNADGHRCLLPRGVFHTCGPSR